MKTKKLITIAKNIAIKNIYKHPLFNQQGRKLHFSFIVADGTIIEWGCNMAHVPPVHMGYSKRINNNEPKLHSELVAYKKAKGLLYTDFEIINIRFNRAGKLRISMPCSVCYSILKELGCKTFYFSNADGSYGKLR
jgi:tRNA(Arg) A34 adenosine deaminase TadA